MTPTNRLRFVERGTDYRAGLTEHGDAVELPMRVLQQWWESQWGRKDPSGLFTQDGEWRDVPLEVESE